MKKLGRVTILSTNEYESLVYECECAITAVNNYSEKLSQMQDTLSAECDAAFDAGKFHAAGGYSHTLPKLKEELRQLREQVARYQPIAEIFQPSDALVTLIQEVNGVSDYDAAADFEVVGHQARRGNA